MDYPICYDPVVQEERRQKAWDDFVDNLPVFYLKEMGSITAKEALQLCGCMRLAARIHDLREKGIPIKTETREYRNTAGNLVRYAIYSLEVKGA